MGRDYNLQIFLTQKGGLSCLIRRFFADFGTSVFYEKRQSNFME